MKKNLTAWIKPFAFKDNQRDELLRVLPRRTEKDRNLSVNFVESVRGEVEMWLSLDTQLLTTSPKEHKIKLEKLKELATGLRKALDEMPADTGATLHAIIYTRLYCEPYSRNHARLAHNLKSLGMPDPLRDDLLEDLLGLIEESSGSMVDGLNVRTGSDNSQTASLAAKLARSYEEYFNKKPSASNGSNFRNFMNELSTITGYEFGAATIDTALKMVESVRQRYDTNLTE